MTGAAACACAVAIDANIDADYAPLEWLWIALTVGERFRVVVDNRNLAGLKISVNKCARMIRALRIIEKAGANRTGLFRVRDCLTGAPPRAPP